MPSSLEGVLVALAMVLDPGASVSDRNRAPADAVGAEPALSAACAPYADPDARRNCLARIGRAAAPDAAFPSELRWVPARDPGMATWLRLPNGLR